MHSVGRKTSSTLWTFCVFSLLVPVLFLLLIEALARLVLVWLPPSVESLEMSMPQWMLEGRKKKSQVKSLQHDWFSLFESGPGFRARLTPLAEGKMNNPFALVPSERKEYYEVKANSLGFRGRELSKSAADKTFRILIFGDSSSFGWGVEQSERYDEVVLSLLEQSAPKLVQFEIGNFAIPGDSSEFGRLVFETFGRDQEADFVIVSFGANDAKLVGNQHQKQVEKFRKDHTLHTLLTYSQQSGIGQLLRRVLVQPPSSQKASDVTEKKTKKRKLRPAVPLKRYRENLTSMLTRSRNLGAEVLFLNICAPRHYTRAMKQVAAQHSAYFLNAQALLNKSIQGLKSGSVYPDLVDGLKGKYGTFLEREELLYVTSDGCHPNSIGHRLIATKLLSRLKSSLQSKLRDR